MENGFEMGKIQCNDKPIDCKMNTGTNVASNGWACDRIDCQAYGNVCPFSW